MEEVVEEEDKEECKRKWLKEFLVVHKRSKAAETTINTWCG